MAAKTLLYVTNCHPHIVNKFILCHNNNEKHLFMTFGQMRLIIALPRSFLNCMLIGI